MPVQVDPGFLAQLLELAVAAHASYQGTTLAGQRRWYAPPASDWTGDPLDVAGASAAFDREGLNADYKGALVDGGTVGDCMAAKLQIDYVAVGERAYRTRHATRIRSAAHAAGRRRAQGSAGGVFVSGVLPYVQGVIAAASGG